MGRQLITWAGAPLMAVSALMGVAGKATGIATTDLGAYALPFWGFIAGLGLMIAGAMRIEKARPVRAAMGAAYAGAGGAYSAPSRPTAAGTPLNADAVHARINQIEAENNYIRTALHAAQVSISR
jgi:hypothetical protein